MKGLYTVKHVYANNYEGEDICWEWWFGRAEYTNMGDVRIWDLYIKKLNFFFFRGTTEESQKWRIGFSTRRRRWHCGTIWWLR